MRLARLDLVRYGAFTGRTLDFGAPPPRGPDLHLVYGPNEAGKSTAFAAYLDLLFGIGGQSPYAFLHPYAAMRIGARLDLAEGPREVVRIKRQSAALLDADERALDEGLIAAELGGIGRDAYRKMFSLDDRTLEDGGEEILASRGDLGQLLFAGSAGAAGLGDALRALREEADGLFRPSSTKSAIADLRRRLDDLKTARATIDTQASLYRQLKAERDAADAGYREALAARTAAEARHREIERLLAAKPRLHELRDARDALERLGPLPQPSPNAAETLREIEHREVELGTELAGLDRDIAALAAEIDGIAVEAAALAAGDAHDGLGDVRARAVTAAEDMPKRRAALAEAEAVVAGALARLGRPAGSDPSAVEIAAGTTGVLRALVAERSGVVERLRRARRERADAVRECAEAREAAGEPALVTDAARRGTARLAGAVDALRDASDRGRIRAAERGLAPLVKARDEALAALAPWAGRADELAGLVLPEPREVDGWAAALDARSAEVELRTEAAARLADEHARLRAEVDALGRLAGVVSEPEAGAVRAARDRAWAEHRGRLDAESADAFADALARDDLVTGARFGHAAETARLKAAALKLAEVEVTLRQAADRETEARRRRAAVETELATALDRIAPRLPPGTTPIGLRAWMERRTIALATRAAAEAAARELADARTDAEAARERLAGALREAAVPHDPAAPFERLMAAARTAIDQARDADSLIRRIAEQDRRAEARARTLAEAETEEADWQTRWREACAACWLGLDAATPSPEAVGEILDLLGRLAPDLQARTQLGQRIAAMETDAATFAVRIVPLAAALGLDPARPPLDLDRAIGARIRAAREAEAARRDRRERLARARERRTAVGDAAAANRRRAEAMQRLFGADTLAEVAAKLEGCAERDRQEQKRKAAAQAILAGVRATDLAEAEALLDAADPDALEAEASALQVRYETADATLRDQHARRLAAEGRLEAVGGDEAAARIEGERRTTLLELEDGAARYLRLRAGIAAAELALAAYRDRHRSAMLARASEAFGTVTRGAYRGLTAQPGEKDADVLLAVAADGKSKEADALSKGTRFQLYLALRAAGFHEFARNRGPVPFVADDIMETFDDARAAEAFRLFDDMAMAGQVIYLTHHRHLVEIARATCPGVRIQEL